MSQAGFGDSSSQENINPLMSEPQSQSQSLATSANALGEQPSLLNVLPRQVLEQELQFCNERSQQAQVLLRQAQEQLQLSQLVIQRQETLTLTLQSRIDQLDRELQDVHTNCDELRDRLKRQQHHTSQLKAALERCLDNSTPAPKDMALSALESWSIAKLADEKITPVEAVSDSPLQNVVKINPVPQPIEMITTQEVSAPELKFLEPEPIEEPVGLSLPEKNQPISPLIVRPHKASQGSPISPNFPKWQPNVAEEIQNKSDERPLIDVQLESQLDRSLSVASLSECNPIIAPDLPSNDSAIYASSAIRNSPMMSPVVAPKFIQALYGSANSDREEDVELAISNSTPRKAVSSLAAVQLPQFPPLTRR